MSTKLKTVHVTLTPKIAELVEAEVASGRFANISEALRNAAWKTFAQDPASELRSAFDQLDQSPEQLEPTAEVLSAEVRAWRSRR